MEKGGYQSLLKSFSKGRPSPELTAGGQNSTVKSVAAPPKSVDELIAGAKAKSPQEGQKDEIPGSGRGRRQPIRPLVGGVKVPLGRQGLSTTEPIARKPIADILQDSSRIRPFKSNAIDQAQAILPEDTVTPGTKEGGQPASSNEKEKEDNTVTLSVNSRRAVFDFSTPAGRGKTNSATHIQDRTDTRCSPRGRAKVLFDYILGNLSEAAPTIVSKHNLLDTKWKYGFAFDAMLNSTVQTDTADLATATARHCQTELVDVGCKWTQHPPTLQMSNPGTPMDRGQLLLDCDGVSSDPPAVILDKPILNSLVSHRTSSPEDLEDQLLEFTKKASKVMMAVLNSKSVHHFSSSCNGGNGPSPLEFGRGLPNLEKLTMHTLHCDGHLIACASAPRKDSSKKGSLQTGKNIVTVWSVHQPMTPKYFLRIYGGVTKMKTELTTDIMVLGTCHGCLNIYDLREEEKYHSLFQDVCVRNPTFHSGCMKEDNHGSKIIGIQILRESKTSTQIVSLDADNVLISWSCMYLPEGDTEDLSGNTAAYSNLRVRARQVIHLSEIILGTPLLSCNCLIAWEGEYKYFLVGTNNGFVAKGRIVSKQFATHSEKFTGESENSLLRILDLDINVKLGLFLGVCDDMYIRLFDLSRQKAIQAFACTGIPIKVLWSKRRLSVFYVALTDEVAIWDILTSDLKPIKKFRAHGLGELELVQVGTKESMAMISDRGTKLSVVFPPCDLTPLHHKGEEVLRHYISIIH